MTRSELSTSQKRTPIAERVREVWISASPWIWRHNDILHLLQNHREDCSDLKNNSLKLVSENCCWIWMDNSQLMALCIMSANMITCFKKYRFEQVISIHILWWTGSWHLWGLCLILGNKNITSGIFISVFFLMCFSYLLLLS